MRRLRGIKMFMVNNERAKKLEIQDIIEDCVIIKVKDIPEHMCNIDLTWLDEEIRKIKDRLYTKFSSALVEDTK